MADDEQLFKDKNAREIKREKAERRYSEASKTLRLQNCITVCLFFSKEVLVRLTISDETPP